MVERNPACTPATADMAARGRIGGYSRAALYSPEELTGKARQGFLRRFEPTDPSLSPEERNRRAQAALRAHMAKLARKSAQKRRRKAGGGTSESGTQ